MTARLLIFAGFGKSLDSSLSRIKERDGVFKFKYRNAFKASADDSPGAEWGGAEPEPGGQPTGRST